MNTSKESSPIRSILLHADPKSIAVSLSLSLCALPLLHAMRVGEVEGLNTGGKRSKREGPR